MIQKIEKKPKWLKSDSSELEIILTHHYIENKKWQTSISFLGNQVRVLSGQSYKALYDRNLRL